MRRAFAVLLVGCSSTPATPAADLAVARDLAAPPAFCAGTLVANTCAQAFFAAAQACVESSTQCAAANTAGGGQAFCYVSGGKLVITTGSLADGGSALYSGVWRAPTGEVCLTAEVPGPSKYNMVLHQGADTLIYDLQGGAVTCPDGSSANIGRVDTCDALHLLLDPNMCLAGTCMP